MVTFDIQAKGIGENAGRIEKMGERGSNMRPVYDPLIDVLIVGEQTLWRKNGGGGKSKWPPNTPSTLARKIARGQGTKPMRATGKAEKSLTVKGAEGMVHYGGGGQLVFGSSVWYLTFSQNPKNPKRKRVVINLTPKTRKSIRQVVIDHITGGHE